MSQETSEWLNTMTLIGFTDKRGHAWHYRESDQGVEPNHYAEAVPVNDVLRRLFNFAVEAQPIFIQVPKFDVQLGFDLNEYVEVKDRKAWIANDTHDVFGIFGEGYLGHQYSQWLLENVATILNGSLGIGSAGLLQNRAQAWVSVEVPENIETPEGVVFRPNLVACTSFNGTLATTYKRTVTNVVCDNTLRAGLSEKGQTYKLKHTKNSGMKLEDAKAALAIVEGIAEDFQAEVKTLCSQVVMDDEWQAILNELVPIPTEDGRGKTLAVDKRNDLQTLWDHDLRVAPWKGSAFGVLQAFNTWDHHCKTVRGASRAERNMSNALSGVTADSDAAVLKVLARAGM